MRLREPKTMAALDSAIERIQATASTVFSDAPTLLLNLMRSAVNYHERSELAATQNYFLTRMETLKAIFGEALREKIDADLDAASSSETSATGNSSTDWSAISLVDDDSIQEHISFGRIGQIIAHECEAPLRELNNWMSAVLHHDRTTPERNPLRGSVVGWAMHRAIAAAAPDASIEAVVVRELGSIFAAALKGCYVEIVDDLRERGLRPAELVAKPVEAQTPRASFGARPLSEDTLRAWEQSLAGRLLVDAGDRGPSVPPRPPAAFSAAASPAFEDDPESSAAKLLERLVRGHIPAVMKTGAPSGRTAAIQKSDTELTALIRRLNDTMDSVRGELDALAPGSGQGAYPSPVPNLIRKNRHALEQASHGKLDHLVIELVSNLFDQILADSQVPPEIARQIARLQLPVLRVAIRDPEFFASRRHPVRRFINRVSSLGTAMDDFKSGPGKELLGCVRNLIQEIIDGDFEQAELYGEKLLGLEQFAAERARADIKLRAADKTIQVKELEWRQLSLFSERVREALSPVSLPTYLKAFLAQVWAQAIAAVSQRDGPKSEAALRYRAAGFRLTVSLLPKRSSDDRDRFVASLPKLMATLNDGITLVKWPQSLRDTFMENLMSGHAGSLKAPAASELDHNLLVKQLESVFKTPFPTLVEAASANPSQFRAPVFEQAFSAEEARSVGLIPEAAVDWVRPVEPAPAEASVGETPPPAAPSPVAPGEPTEAAGGPQPIEHLQVGVSYSLYLQDHWETVRLAYMSPARTFFMFMHGSHDLRSISMTARMLERLWAARRMRTLEISFLIDRATERARQQMAALLH